ncbi:hypothetical protein MIND_01421200 [Mycena indigotica]|uniref:Uncharacterized protein n=1 Tax=Mycena indigotica TaxID=2126181 RepID=A0A8H6RY00_9AGAR|nr:uncharacterized protein MIND_01421200 [Mycena indigotica]KAF7288758.1 hypothetical protein MIND_01421200 [Mycena indigotica]
MPSAYSNNELSANGGHSVRSNGAAMEFWAVLERAAGDKRMWIQVLCRLDFRVAIPRHSHSPATLSVRRSLDPSFFPYLGDCHRIWKTAMHTSVLDVLPAINGTSTHDLSPQPHKEDALLVVKQPAGLRPRNSALRLSVVAGQSTQTSPCPLSGQGNRDDRPEYDYPSHLCATSTVEAT